MSDDNFKNFNLVGGTALSLQIGHRKSVDIDLFNTSNFNSTSLAGYIEDRYDAKNIKVLKNGIFCFIDEVKVDVIAHQYPLLFPLTVVEGIRMTGLRDIAGMKLHA